MAIRGLALLTAQRLIGRGECLTALCALPGAASRGVTARDLAAAVTAAALAREAAARGARRSVWAHADRGAGRAVLLAEARAAGGGLLLGAECEALAREVVGRRLRRMGARHGR